MRWQVAARAGAIAGKRRPRGLGGPPVPASTSLDVLAWNALFLNGRRFLLCGPFAEADPDRLTRQSERAIGGQCHSQWHPGISRGRQIGPLAEAGPLPVGRGPAPRLGGSQYQTRQSCSPLTSNGPTFIGIAPCRCIDFARQNFDLRRHLQSSVPSPGLSLASDGAKLPNPGGSSAFHEG